MDLRNELINTTSEIFTTMVMMDITEDASCSVNFEKLENTISGFVGLAGAYKGVVAIHVPYNVAFAITGSFLGIDVSELNEDVEDAIGELANMVGGSVKSLLTENGGDIDLSLPSTVSGREYAFQTLQSAERVSVPFKVEAGNLLLDVQLE